MVREGDSFQWNQVPSGISSIHFESPDVPKTPDRPLQGLDKLEDVHVPHESLDNTQLASLRVAFPQAVITVAPAPLPALSQQAPAARTVNFGSRELGKLFTRKWNAGPGSAWTEFGRAKGKVVLPANKAVKLEIAYDAASDLSVLAKLDPNALHSIGLIGDNVSDAELRHAAALTGLRGFRILLGKRVTDKGLAVLANMPYLQELELNQVHVTDKGLAFLTETPRLESLSISSAPITNASLTQFKELKMLRKLHIEATAISPRALNIIKIDLPECEIVF